MNNGTVAAIMSAFFLMFISMGIGFITALDNRASFIGAHLKMIEFRLDRIDERLGAKP